MNPVLADTCSTENKAVVMEGNYPNLAPYHTRIKTNHIKSSALVSCHMCNKNMLFSFGGRLVSAWQSCTGTTRRAPDTHRRNRMLDMITGRAAFVQDL